MHVSSQPGLTVEIHEESAVLTIAEGVQLAEPVRVSIALEGGAHATKVTLKAGPRSRAVIVEEATGAGEWTHEVDVFVGAEANIEYASIQTLDASATATTKQRGETDTGGVLTWRNVTVGGANVQGDVHSRVIGADGISGIDWLCFAVGSEKYDLTCKNIFDAPRGGGEVLMKGAAQEKAHINCRGLIAIGLGGGGTNTYLTQDVLMLDPTSKVDAIPSLEIKTNDVKASPSAVVSRVTPEDLFYFGSRGIAPADARRLFIEGFLGQIAERMPYARELVTGAISAKMGL